MASLDSIMNEDEQQDQIGRRSNGRDADSATARPRPPPSRHPSGNRHRPTSEPAEDLSQGRGQVHITPGHRILPHTLSNDNDQAHHLQPSDLAPQEAQKARDILSPQASIEPSPSSSAIAQSVSERPVSSSKSATPRSRSKRAIRKASSSLSLSSSSLRQAKNKRSIQNLANKRTKETTSSSSTTRTVDASEPTEPTDAMDHGAYVEAAHMASFSHMGQEPSNAMRPPYFQPVMDTEFPYPRVTPRTGRLSRAKKGLPVHYCEPCNKWFTRAEHLRRHQLSHDSPQFKCSFDACDRAFFRKDLLERHVQRHEQEDGTMPRSSSGSESPKPRTPRTPRRASRPHSQSPRPAPYPVVARPSPSATNEIRETVLSYAMATSHARRGSEDVQMAPSPMASSPMGSSTISSSPMGSPHYQSHGRDYSTDAYPAHTMSMMAHYSHPSVPEHMAQQAPRYTGSSVELYALGTSGQLPPPVGMAPNNNAPDIGARGSWPSSSAMPLGTAAHAVSQPSQNEYPGYYAGHGGSGSGNGMHSHSGSGSGYYPPPLMSMPGMSFPPDQVAMAAPGAGPLYVGSLSSSYANETQEAQTSGVLVPIAASSVPPERAVEPDPLVPHGPGPGFEVPRSGNLALPAVRAPSPLVPDSAWAAMPDLLEFYWDTVSSIVTIVHPVTFKRTHGQSLVLRYAMAVLASQMRGTRDDLLLGVQLYEYAWPMCVEQAKTDEPLPISLLAAITILELFGRFRARRLERQTSEAFKKTYIQTYNSTMAEYNNPPPPTASPHTESSWIDWIEAETRRRIFSLCYVTDVHTSKYFQQPMVMDIDLGSGDMPPVPLACGTAALWKSDTPTMWAAIANALGTTPVYVTSTLLASLTPSSLNNYSRADRFALLATYILFPSPVSVDGFASVKPDEVSRDTRRFISLYGNCALTNTYLALRYTPLHDLLAISGDTWVFGRKLEAASFAESQRRLKEWRMSHCAHIATGFAARALVSFLHSTNVRQSSTSPVIPGPPSVASPTTPSTPSSITVPITFADEDRSRIMTSHHWSMYVCALICWAFGHHARKAAPPPPDTEAAGIRWLREMAASFSAPREQKEARAAHAGWVPGVVRKILETDDEMPFRSWLFIEAVSVLKKLE